LRAEERRVEEEHRRAMIIAAEEAERARIQQQEELRQRCEIAILDARDEALVRIQSLRRMGCSDADLLVIYSKDMLDSVEIVPDLMPCVEKFSDCVDPDLNVDDTIDVADEQAPEPIVDWELKKKLASDEFPSVEQTLAVAEAGSLAKDLATQLTEFYLVHNLEMVSRVPELVKQYKSRPDELNEALQRRYRCNLSTFRTVASTVVDLHVNQRDSSSNEVPQVEEPVAAMAMPTLVVPSAAVNQDVDLVDSKLAEAMKTAEDMGFSVTMEQLAQLMKKHNDNVDHVFSELLG